MRRETKLVHYGRGTLPGPANPPVMRASTILHDTVESFRDTKARREVQSGVLSYGRRGTTTAHALAEAVRDLEAGDETCLFPTGIAAITSVLASVLSSGDHLLVVDTVFPSTRALCREYLPRLGIEIEYFPWDCTDLAQYVRPNTRAVFVESPGSQTFEIMDLPSLTDSAKLRSLTVIADNTYGSGWLYRPLELGCDISIIAGTKYLSGHADTMMGAATAKGEICAQLRHASQLTGQILSPDEAYACLRGIRTLGLRLERHADNSLAFASWLRTRPEVRRVWHPAFLRHPGNRIWQRDGQTWNGLLSVAFKDGFPVDAFLDALELFAIGTSWGGFESLAMPIDPAKERTFWSNGDKPPQVRFHVGLEHIDDILADLGAAFDTIEAGG
ncbi:MAG: cystathionine beta-lyase [Pseudomonadota bacterium]